MILTESQRKFLAISPMETAVMDALASFQMAKGYSELARITKVPRTSLYTAVQNLIDRGFVKKAGSGKWPAFMMVPQEKMHHHFSELAEKTSVALKGFHTKAVVRGANAGEYAAYRGADNLVALYYKFLGGPRNSRIYGIQPNESAHSLLKRFPYEALTRLNDGIKRKKIIVEAVLQENFLETYRQNLEGEGKPVRDIFEAYGGRMADTGYVPKEFFNFDSELMMTDSFAVIANWKEMVAVEIRDREVVGMLKQMFEFIKSQTKKVDQNPAVARIISSATRGN